jgi:F0F1-type ATP synthase assembly protein I
VSDRVTALTNSIRAQLYKILFWQLIILMGFALVIGLIGDIQKSYSALSGSLAYWIPTFLFLTLVSTFTGARAAMRFMVAFFSGEVAKLALSCVLFVFAMRYLAMDPIFGLVGLGIGIATFWIVSAASLLRGVKA